jgi:uncharacterized protein YbjQ (UPF0145 family)
MPATTAHSFAEYTIVETMSVVGAESVLGVNVFGDFLTGLSDAFGGRSRTSQEALRRAREDCLREIKHEAAARGGNAVIGITFTYDEIAGQGKAMLFVAATGTAVRLSGPDTSS